MGVEGYNKERLDRLKDHKVLFDKDAMWRDMQKKKKRRGAFFFFTMALVALAIVILTVSLWSKTKDKATMSNFQNFEKEARNIENTRQADSEELNLSSLDVEDSSSDIKEEIKKVDEDFKPVPKTVVNSEENNDVNVEKLIEDNNLPVTRIHSSHETYTKEIEHHSTRTPELNNDTFDNETRNNVFKTAPDSDSTKKTEAQIKSLQNETNLSIENIYIKRLPVFRFPFIRYEAEKLNLDHLIAKESKIIDITPTTKSRWAVGGYGGYGLPTRSTVTEINPDESSFIKDETLEEVSVGIELKYQVRPDLYIRSGLEYWHVTDRLTSASSELVNLADINNSFVGLEEGQKGIILKSQVDIKHTIYQTLNIPIVVGYNTNYNKFNVFAEAGILANIYNSNWGSYYENEVVTNQTLQLAPLIGLGLSYSLNNKVDLFGRANWRGAHYVSNNVETENQEKKFSATRFQLGLRIGM